MCAIIDNNVVAEAFGPDQTPERELTDDFSMTHLCVW